MIKILVIELPKDVQKLGTIIVHTLYTVWIKTVANTLFPVLLNIQDIRIRIASIDINWPAIHTGSKSEAIQNGMCHIAHNIPKTRLAFKEFHRPCIGSKAYPIQPTSSNIAKMKNARNATGAAIIGSIGAGIGSPRKISTPKAKVNMTGNKKKIGKYHIWYHRT